MNQNIKVKDNNIRDNNIRVLMLAPTPFFADRGCHVKILEEIRSLTSRGIIVKLVTYHNGRNIEGLDIERIINIPWYKKLEAGPSKHKYYLDLLLGMKALKTALRFKPDIIHAHLHEGVFAGKIVQFFIRKPLVADYQGSMVGEMLDHGFMKKGSFSYKFNKWIENTVNKWPQKIIFSSTKAKEYFLNNFKTDPGRVVSFIEGTNTDFFHPGYDTSELREKWKLPSGKKFVVYAGVLTKYQGIDMLIESINSIIKRYSDVHFLIVGFPNVEYYENMAREKNVQDYVTFTGKVSHEEIPRYLNIGDIGVSLKFSLTEANGKLFGYMAVGLPCIVFDTATNREILGETGIYAEYNNKESFIDKLVQLLENEKEAKRIGDLSRARVLGQFTWDNTFSNFVQIYKDLINKNNGNKKKNCLKNSSCRKGFLLNLIIIYERGESDNGSKVKIKLFYKKNKKKLFTILRILISIGLIVYLVKSQFKDLKTIVEIIKTISVPLLLASASMHIIGIWLSAVRWQILLKTQGKSVSQPFLASSFLIGSFFNNFLPTSIGGDVFRSYDISRKTSLPIGKSVCVIVIDRFSGVISAAIYAIVALLLGISTVGTKSYIIPIIIFFIVCIIIAFLLLNPSVLRLHKLIDRIGFLHRIREKLKEVYHTFQGFKKYKLALALSLLCSLALQFAVIINYFLAAKSLGIILPLSSFIFIVPVVATIAMLPISIGGTGIRENSLVLLLVAFGVSNSKAAMCSLILLAMLLILGIAGGIILALRPFLARGKLQAQDSQTVHSKEP